MNLNRICRFCLEEKSNLMPLFTDENLTFRIKTLSPSVKINPDDGMPSQICSKCVWLANSSFRFHMQCRVSQIALDNQKAGMCTDHISKVKQISMTNDVRRVGEHSATSQQLQKVANSSQTETITKKTVSTMTDCYAWPYVSDKPRQWCAYIQCNYITKDNVFVKALNDVITKNSNLHFPEIRGRRIYQMDLTVRVLLNSKKRKNRVIIPPIIDLTADEEENAVITTNLSNHIGLQTDKTNIRIAVLKKSCLKRTENLDVSPTSTKKVRFSEPTHEHEEQIICNFKEQLAHCTTCKRVFESNMDFVQFVKHLKEHGQQDITCMKCNQTFNNSEHMFIHLNNCKQADNSKLTDVNKSKVQLKRNQHTRGNERKKTGKKMHSLHVCEFCEESFSEAHHLLNHIRLHFPYNEEEEEDSSDYEL